MQSQIGPVNVKVFSGLEPEGDEYKRCRITFFGNKAKMYHMFDSRWHEVDTLANTSVVERGKDCTITGTSRSLIVEVGLAPSNAQVRWEVEYVGCRNCN